MNFTGQHRKPRNVNLGGRAAVGTSNRQSLLRRAQLDREKRETARRELKAAVAIQQFFRGRLLNLAERTKVKEQWDSVYLNVQAGGALPSLSSESELAQFLREYAYFERPPLYDVQSETTQRRAQLVVSVLEKYQDHGAGLAEAVPAYTLASVVNGSVNTGLAQAQDAVAPELLRIAYLLSAYTTSEVLESLVKVAKRESDPNSALWPAIAALSNVHPETFWTCVLTIPRYYDHFKADPALAAQLGSRLSSGAIPEKALESYPLQDVLTLLDNLLLLISRNGMSVALLSLANVVLYTLSNRRRLGPVRTELHSDSDELSSETDEPGSQLLASADPELASINDLYSRDLTTQVFALTNDGKDGTLHTVASFYVNLLRLSPRMKQGMLPQLTFVKGGSHSAVHTFWTSFKQSQIYNLTLEGVLPYAKLVQLVDSEAQAWTQLVLALELYSYWLIVADDTEFLENETQGLPLDEVREMAAFLRNHCFSLIWNSGDLQSSRQSNYAFGQFKKMKVISLRVLRQIYTRDGRRPFLPKNFWLMTQHFNMSMFISGVVQEQERIINLAYQDDDDGHHEDENEGRRGGAGGGPSPLRPADRYTQNVEPRLNILREAPFFIPFDTRVQLLQKFISNDKERVDPRSFFDSMMGPAGREPLSVSRGHLFDDAFDNQEKLDMKHQIRIEFNSEHGVEAGIDGGGLTKEFLTSACAEAFDPERGLFVSSTHHLLYPNPVLGITTEITGMSAQEKSFKLSQLNFLGKLIGKCLYEGILVDAEFAPFFLQKILGIKSSFDDLYALDPDIYHSMVKLRKYDGDVENDMNLTFSIDQEIGGRYATIGLVRGGDDIPVTNSNRLEYIHAIANFKLNLALSQQANAFFSGMSTVISPHWLKMFNALELQMLISGGHAKIDVMDLKRNTVYGGFVDGDETVKQFWQVVEELSEEDRSLLVKFVTSTPKAPLGGFKMLSPRFALRNAGRSEMERLPTSSTCVNLLKLPDYRDKETLKAKLLYSIRAEAGFHLS